MKRSCRIFWLFLALALDEQCFRVRSECRIFVPSNCTHTPVLKLEMVQYGESLGLERLFMCKSTSGAAKISAGYLVAHDTELVRLGKGFANMEPWGCWTDGAVAELDLVIPPRFKGKDFT